MEVKLGSRHDTGTRVFRHESGTLEFEVKINSF
jgi:hypothetical protein